MNIKTNNKATISQSKYAVLLLIFMSVFPQLTNSLHAAEEEKIEYKSTVYANASLLIGQANQKRTVDGSNLRYNGLAYRAGFQLGGTVTSFLAIHGGFDLTSGYKMALSDNSNISDTLNYTCLVAGLTFLLPKDVHISLLFRPLIAGPSVAVQNTTDDTRYDIANIKSQNIGYGLVFTKEFNVTNKGYLGFLISVSNDSLRYQRTLFSESNPTGVVSDITSEVLLYGTGISMSIY